jgi:glucose/arabinose dehydrogenase/mono/diheme cytochrome c family protein
MPFTFATFSKKLNIQILILAGIIACYACVPEKKAGTKTADAGLTTQPSTELTAGTKPYFSTDTQVLAKGQQLFETNCSTCHNFLQKGIGPNLAQVTSQTSPEWLAKFIRNAPGVITAGDARAKQLFEEYKQYMPPFPQLTDTDIQALLSYIHKNQKLPTVDKTAAHLGTALTNPVPTAIPKSGLQLMLEEVTTAPATADKVPLARINKMQVLPGEKNRLFIEDLRGILYEMKGNQLQVYMDMQKERPGFSIIPGLANGFGSYAFHPDFYKNGLLYTTHTEKPDSAPADFAYDDSIKVTSQWVLTEWKVNKPAAEQFSGTGREMMRINMVSNIHGVQEITFNPFAKPGSPDYGLLYIGVGDGGASENGFYFLCNSNKRVWSSVLRIDPAGRNSRNGRYGIPSINPFAQDADEASLGEIFCRGFRNPNRICWTSDEKMLITDIGHANAEELNIGIAGAEYGWPEREGTFVINHGGDMKVVYNLPENDSSLHYTYPVAFYDHDEGNAISGGFVYSGTAVPLLSGKYIFGDIVNGRVFYVENKDLALGKQALIQEMEIQVAGKTTSFQELSGSKKTDLRFGIGLNNDFYLYTKADGKIYKINGCSVSN